MPKILASRRLEMLWMMCRNILCIAELQRVHERYGRRDTTLHAGRQCSDLRRHAACHACAHDEHCHLPRCRRPENISKRSTKTKAPCPMIPSGRPTSWRTGAGVTSGLRSSELERGGKQNVPHSAADSQKGGYTQTRISSYNASGIWPNGTAGVPCCRARHFASALWVRSVDEARLFALCGA